MSIDCVIFDLGNVLIPWDPERLYRDLITDESERRSFLREVCSPEWNAQQDAGRSLAVATETRIAEYPAYEELIRAYYRDWEKMLDAPIPGSVAILDALQQRGLRVLALTNWSAETFVRACPLYPLLDRFEGILVSGHEGLVKPDPAIFRLMFDRYRVDPARTVFLDDSIPNVRAARELGLHAIHFQTPIQARAELEALGVLEPERC